MSKEEIELKLEEAIEMITKCIRGSSISQYRMVFLEKATQNIREVLFPLWSKTFINTLTPISNDEVRQNIDLLQTNAVEGLEETQNTIDSQNAINNITFYISQLESTNNHLKHLLNNQVDMSIEYDGKEFIELPSRDNLQSKLDKIKEVVDLKMACGTAREVYQIAYKIKQILEDE